MTEYINKVVAFDIETSKIIEYEGRTITTDEYNQLSKKERQNTIAYGFMYRWMMDDEGEYTIDCTWKSFEEKIAELKAKYQYNSKKHLIIWVHNLAFEWQFIKYRFEWEEKECLMVKNRKPVKLTTKDGLEFRCSYLYSNCALKDLVLFDSDYQKMTGDLDYELVRVPSTILTPEEEKYCEMDVRVLRKYIQQELKHYKDFKNFPLTSTGKVRAELQKVCLLDPDFITIKAEMKMDYDSYELLKKCYTGGFTHCSRGWFNIPAENVKHIDFTSSYPAVMVMSKEYPIGEGKFVDTKMTQKQFDFYLTNYAFASEITFFNIRAQRGTYDYPISESKCENKLNVDEYNGRVVKADRITVGLTNIDYKIVDMFYDWDAMEIRQMKIYKKGYLPKVLQNEILRYYVGKTTLKGVINKEDEYQRLKALLNSIYGMMVKKLDDGIIPLDIGDDEVLGFSLHDESDKPGFEKRNIEYYNNNKKRVAIFEWGVWTTALAKYNLLEGIRTIGADYLYADTDSIFFVGEHSDYIDEYNNDIFDKIETLIRERGIDRNKLIPKTVKGKEKPIGVWDYEDDTDKVPVKRFKSLGAKRYIQEFADGRITITFAGVRKASGSKYFASFDDPIEAFDEGIKIPHEVAGKTLVKLNRGFTKWIEDYQGNVYPVEEKSGCSLVEQDYNIEMLDGISKQLDIIDALGLL